MALEQNEIKKVISVDLGNTISSLKEYKDYIDGLRDSLTKLDATSEEYKKIASELADAQDRLNEAISEGKYQVDTAKILYDNLSQALADLKKQMSETNDEATKIELGQKISDVNDKLQSLSDSTNDYTKNVENLATSIETTFETSAETISEVEKPLSDASNSVIDLDNNIGSLNDSFNNIADAADTISEVEKPLSDASNSVIDLDNNIGSLNDSLNEIGENTNGIDNVGKSLNNTATSIKEYKAHIEELRGLLLQIDESSEEYKTISEEIFNEQQKLNEVMKVGKTQVDAETGSYNALTKQMAELKKQWRATGDETKRAELGGQILDINNKLKDLDASTGNYQRNVGAYEQGFSKAMSNLKGGLISSVPAFGKVNTAMKMLAANPIGLVITALVTAFTTLKSAISGSEEQTNRIKKAFSVFQPVVNAIKNAISGVAEAFVWLAEKASDAVTFIMRGLKNMFEAFGWDEWSSAIQESLDAMEYANGLEERNIELNKQKRENLVTEAQLRLDISELETKIADKQKYSEKERLAFLDEWEKKSRQIAQMRLDAATQEYELIRDNNALTESNSADLEREAQARAKMLDEQRSFNKEIASIASRRSEILGREQSAVSKITAEREKQKQKEQQLLEKDQEMIKAIEQRLEDEKKTELQKLKDKYDEEYALLVKYEKDTTALTEEYEAAKAKIIASKQQEAYEEAQKARQSYYDTIKSESEQRIFEIENDANIEIQTEKDKEEAIFAIRQDALTRQMNAVQEALTNDKLTTEQRKELQKEYDELDKQLTNNQIIRSKQLKDQEKKDAEEAAEARKAAQMSTLTGAASLFGALAELSEENSEEQKAFSIMETTINGLAAVIGTFKGYAEFGPWGWAAAIAQAATITTSTIATVNKIKNTNKTSSGSNASVTAPTAQNNTPAMTAVSPLLNEQDDINRYDTSGITKESDNSVKNLRVYVVDQDIRDANNRAEVIENNTTF